MQCTFGLRQVQLSQDLIAFRALSGCDNISFTAGHSKKIMWQVSYDRHELRCGLRDDDQTQETISSAKHLDATHLMFLIMFISQMKPDVCYFL